MKVLHTSDWHLGRSLYEKKRHNEFSKFLDWLFRFIAVEHIDILLVAGDIFDTTTPNNQAQEMYYRFLADVSKTSCRHVVIIGGNHDSPSFLNAPKEILRALNVHVLGDISGNPEHEVIVLTNRSSLPEAIICAVPFLRDRDIRTVEAGESPEDKSRKLTEGISAHYTETARIALDKVKVTGSVPVIGMGHLFTSGGKTVEGDGVRELYVGNLAHLDEDMFPGCFGYLALGHLHFAQRVGTSEFKRYSGFPIPMGFGEARQEKKVIVAEFGEHPTVITEHIIPCFQELERISGGKDEILNRISELIIMGSKAWLEIDFTEQIPAADLTQLVVDALDGSDMEICRIKNRILADHALKQVDREETLDDLNEMDVFTRLLDVQKDINQEQREELIQTYRETIRTMQEEDPNAN